MFKRFYLTAVFVLMACLNASAQISVPNTLVAGTTIRAADLNTNFTYIADRACNRTGCTLTATINVQAILPTVDATYTLGDGTKRFTTGSFSGTVTAGTFSGQLSGTIAAATQDLITRTGTLVAGATGAGFTVALSTSTITGTLADARLSANVPLLNAPNTFTGNFRFSANSASPGAAGISRNATYGLLFQGASGLSYDFTVINAAASADVIRVPTGTSNVEIPSGLLTVSGAGAHSFSGTIAGGNNIILRNSSTGTGSAAGFYVGNSNTASVGGFLAYSSGYMSSGPFIADAAVLYAERAAGLSIVAHNASGEIRFYAGGTTQRFGINASGDWLKGSNIMDSTGTPTIESGFGTSPTIAGTDYAFVVTPGGGTSGSVAFGRASTNAPVCVAAGGNGGVVIGTTDTIRVNMTYTTTTLPIRVICRGY